MIRTAEIAARQSDSPLCDGIPEVDVATLAQVANDAAAGPRPATCGIRAIQRTRSLSYTAVR